MLVSVPLISVLSRMSCDATRLVTLPRAVRVSSEPRRSPAVASMRVIGPVDSMEPSKSVSTTNSSRRPSGPVTLMLVAVISVAVRLISGPETRISAARIASATSNISIWPVVNCVERTLSAWKSRMVPSTRMSERWNRRPWIDSRTSPLTSSSVSAKTPLLVVTPPAPWPTRSSSRSAPMLINERNTSRGVPAPVLLMMFAARMFSTASTKVICTASRSPAKLRFSAVCADMIVRNTRLDASPVITRISPERTNASA